MVGRIGKSAHPVEICAGCVKEKQGRFLLKYLQYKNP